MHWVDSTGALARLTLRGGWTRSKRHVNILPLIAFFSLVFHMTLNSHNTNLKNGGVDWG